MNIGPDSVDLYYVVLHACNVNVYKIFITNTNTNTNNQTDSNYTIAHFAWQMAGIHRNCITLLFSKVEGEVLADYNTAPRIGPLPLFCSQ